MAPQQICARTTVSVIAPVYNEEANLDEFINRLAAVADRLEERYQLEIVLVDDGSTDKSADLIEQRLQRDSRIRLIQLSRNFGQTAALQAGFDAAVSEIVVTLDSDLQHAPEEIPAFLRTLNEGYDVVCGWRQQRVDGLVRRAPSAAANWLVRRISGVPCRDVGTTFRAYRREYYSQFRLTGEFHRFIPALAFDAGARITEIPIQSCLRGGGSSKCGLGRTFGVLVDLVTLTFLLRYKDRPMRAFGGIALLFGAAGIGLLAWLPFRRPLAEPWADTSDALLLLAASVLITGSVLLFTAGVLAELLVRIQYSTGEHRVYTVVRELRSSERPRRAVA